MNSVLSVLSNASEVFKHHYPGSTMLYYFGFTYLTVAATLLFELGYFGWEKSALRRLTHPSPSAKIDLALAVTYAASLTPFLAVILSFGIAAVVPAVVKKYFGYNLLHNIRSPWARTLVYMALFDFCFYWKHRSAHAFSWWWDLHELHHSAREMNLITSNRIHPFDEALARVFVCLPTALAGAPPESFLWLRLLHLAQLQLLHSMLPWDWGWIGRWVLVSPVAHRVHHSDDGVHRDKNFGELHPLWDRLFGTYYEGTDKQWTLAENPKYHRQPWYLDLWDAYTRSCRSMLRAFRRESRMSSVPGPGSSLPT